MWQPRAAVFEVVITPLFMPRLIFERFKDRIATTCQTKSRQGSGFLACMRAVR
jgi:hypothetical protein